jgi:hypothetical protein
MNEEVIEWAKRIVDEPKTRGEKTQELADQLDWILSDKTTIERCPHVIYFRHVTIENALKKLNEDSLPDPLQQAEAVLVGTQQGDVPHGESPSDKSTRRKPRTTKQKK